MTHYMRITALFLFTFISSTSIAQYKYDIGFKTSTNEMERFQLEQRFHLNSPFSIVVTLMNGSRNSGNYYQTGFYSDSLFDVGYDQLFVKSNSLKIGVQRKLGFLATDVFYAGVSIGMGFKNLSYTNYNTTYSIVDSMAIEPSTSHPNLQTVTNTVDGIGSRAINTQIAVSFGMDVPISKRLSINTEIGFAGNLTQYSTFNSTMTYLIPSISGGLRYQFGKRE